MPSAEVTALVQARQYGLADWRSEVRDHDVCPVTLLLLLFSEGSASRSSFSKFSVLATEFGVCKKKGTGCSSQGQVLRD